MAKSYRARLIGMIHIQKQAAQLTDDVYKQIVIGATGKESCTNCEIKELFKIHRDLNAVLVSQGRKAYTFYRSPREKGSIQDAVMAKAKKIFGENEWFERLQGFLKKINKTSLSYCTQTEIRQVMGWLSTMERNKKKENKK